MCTNKIIANNFCVWYDKVNETLTFSIIAAKFCHLRKFTIIPITNQTIVMFGSIIYNF